MTHKSLKQFVIKIMLTLALGVLAVGGFTSISMAAEGEPLEGEVKGSLADSPMHPANVKKKGFMGFFSRSGPIEPTDKYFSSVNLYDKQKQLEVKQELGINGNVVAVPRARAIQLGEVLDKSAKHDSPNTTWSIDGEYGFVPTFGPNTEVSIFKKNAKTGQIEEQVIYKKEGSGKTVRQSGTPSRAKFINGETGYVKFTNLGFYKGEPVTIVIEPDPNKTIEHQVYVGLLSPKDTTDGNTGYMSISASGEGKETESGKQPINYARYNVYGKAYVDMNYKFYNAKQNANWKKELAQNDKSSMLVQGFYTYADFDYEESIGIPKSVKINNLYVLQGGGVEDKGKEPMPILKDPFNPEKFEENYFNGNYGNYKNDPLGLKYDDLAKNNPFGQYLEQYSNKHSDWQSQLGYSVSSDGYRYFNRGARSNTEPYRISNWLSFTYEETKEFNLRINVTPLESVSISSTESLRKLINDNLLLEEQDSRANNPHIINTFDWVVSTELVRNTLFYKIMDKKLEDKGITKVETVDDVKKILKFVDPEGTFYQFDEKVDGDKVVIPYNADYDQPGRTDLKDKGKDGYKNFIEQYYAEMYLKYSKQKVKDSNEQKLAELMYSLLVKVEPGKPYSVYGFNSKNIGNFYVQYNGLGDEGEYYTQAKNASSTKANSSMYFFNSNWGNINPAKGVGKSTNLLNRFEKEDDLGYRYYDYATSMYGQNTNPQGSNVYFTSDTLLPIAFPHPLKIVEMDDSKQPSGKIENIVTWDIIQFVPPRLLNNYEPKYVFSDKVNPLLKIDNFEIVDAETTTISEKSNWVTSGSDKEGTYGISADKKSLTIKPTQKWQQDPNFNNRHFVIRIQTSVDQAAVEKMTAEELDKYEVEDGFTKVPNAGTVSMVPREGTDEEYHLYTRPTYQEKASPESVTIGKIKFKGNLTINKVAEEDSSKKLSGAEFEVWTTDGKSKIASGVTNAQGQVILPDIPVGEYLLKETKAPLNYRPINDKKITVYPFNHSKNTLEIKNRRALLVGSFDTVKKTVKDENKNNIDGQLVAYDQVLTYEISGNIKKETPETEINAVSLLDTLDSGLEKINGTTTVVKNNDAEVVLEDSQVWSLTSDGREVLDTSSQDKFAIGDNDVITFKFKAKVKHTAGKTVENTGELQGKGLKSDGSEFKPKKATNTVTNYLSDAIYLRQVIVDKNADLAVPLGDNKGFFKLNNTDATGKLTTYSTVNVSVPSGESAKLPDFKKVMVSPTESSSVYTVNGIIPEMYDYKGYVMSSDGNQSIEMNQIKTGVPKIDLSKKDNRYVTLVMIPKEKKVPLFYNWDYKLNEFGKLNVKGKQVRLKFYTPQDRQPGNEPIDTSVPVTLIDLPTYGKGVLIPSFNNLDKYYYRIPYLTQNKHYQQGTILEDIVLKNIASVDQLSKKIPINLYFTDKDGKEKESISGNSNGISAEMPLNGEYLVGFNDYTATQKLIDTKSNPNEIIIWYSTESVPIIQDW